MLHRIIGISDLVLNHLVYWTLLLDFNMHLQWLEVRRDQVGPQPLPLSMYIWTVMLSKTGNLRLERGGKAGGWSIELSKKRTLEEAFVSIWVCMTSQPQTHPFLHALVKHPDSIVWCKLQTTDGNKDFLSSKSEVWVKF